MKKSVSVMMAIALCAAMVSGCSGSGGQKDTAADTKAAVETTASGAAEKGSEEQTAAAENKKIDKLNVYFVPSREPEEIVTATEPLKEMLKTELAREGYDIGEVVITVGTSYEAVGEALSAGTADIGLIPGGTYVLYDDGADVILTATRDGLSKNSDSAKDWNDGKATEPTDQQVTSYRALMIAGPSEKGQELAKKVNSGEALTFDDLSSANWSVMSSSSPAGYIYGFRRTLRRTFWILDMRFSPILTAAHLQDWLPDRWMSSVHTQTPAETMKKSGIPSMEEADRSGKRRM